MTRIHIPRQRTEDGYILLTILLWVSLLSITAATSLTMLTYYHQQMKRDQEEELVHRGVEYERAIRKYYRKFGSYPATIEMLEDSNHMRFLRRRYKDPITGKDFKVLQQVDVMMAFGNAIGGGGIAGAQTLGQSIGSLNASPSTPAPDASTNGSGAGQTDSSPGQASSNQNSGTPQNSGTTLPFTAISGQPASTQTMGGGGIAGVASVSTEQSIRVYNKKDHYNDWLFAYNPAGDRGGLPKGPYDPAQALVNSQLNGLQNGLNGLNGMNGQNGQNGTNQPFGQNGSGFGQGNNMGQGMPTPNRR
jgi:type II secretory pathway pseudopilin PulG